MSWLILVIRAVTVVIFGYLAGGDGSCRRETRLHSTSADVRVKPTDVDRATSIYLE
jgi:hypothetical protein